MKMKNNDEIYEIVVSPSRNQKIIIRGFIMSLENQHNDFFYWGCNRKNSKCKGNAVTKHIKGQHYLKAYINHNHPSAVCAVKILPRIEGITEPTNQPVSEIIQSHTNEEINPHLPSKGPKLFHQKKDLEIPLDLQNTLKGDLFLIKNCTILNELILIFCTKENIHLLSLAQYWIIDSKFKTVSNNILIINGECGQQGNSLVSPLVYVLMTKESEESYVRLFQELKDFAQENEILLKPKVIFTDLDRAIINATTSEFPEVVHKVYFFHFSQTFWEKIKSSELDSKYVRDKLFALILRQICSLAFLPPNRIPKCFNTLKKNLITENNDIIKWFDENFVSGRVRRILPNGTLIHAPPVYPPTIWSLHNTLELEILKSQNMIQIWHDRWKKLVENSEPKLFNIIKAFQKAHGHIACNIQFLGCYETFSQINRNKRLKKIIEKFSHLTADVYYILGIAQNIYFGDTTPDSLALDYYNINRD